MAAGLHASALIVRMSSRVNRNGLNGILLPPEHVKALAEVVVNLGFDPVLRQALGDQAAHLSEHVSQSSVAAQWHAFLGG